MTARPSTGHLPGPARRPPAPIRLAADVRRPGDPPGGQGNADDLAGGPARDPGRGAEHGHAAGLAEADLIHFSRIL
ncbi:MAG: hypothetical protein WAK82_23955 [Streptosporangiaceae bacterium]